MDTRPDFALDGPAITQCLEITEENRLLDFHVDLLAHHRQPSPGEFWVDNGTAATQVSFCPFCGEPAPVPRRD